MLPDVNFDQWDKLKYIDMCLDINEQKKKEGAYRISVSNIGAIEEFCLKKYWIHIQESFQF